MVEVGEVGAGCLGGVLGLISLQKLSPDNLPVIGVNTVLGESLNQPTALSLKHILNSRSLRLSFQPAISPASLPQTVWLAVKQRDVGQSFGTIMVIQDLREVLSSGDIDDGSRWVNHRVGRRVDIGHDEAVSMLRV